MHRYARRKRRVEAIRNGTWKNSTAAFEVPNWIKYVAVPFGIVVIWIYSAIVRVLLGDLSNYWLHLASRLHNEAEAGTVALVIGFVGFGFYELRKRRRMIYSVVEFSAALIVTTEACLRTNEPATLAAALMSGIYFVVRSFDNFEKAFVEWDAPTEPDSVTQAKAPTKDDAVLSKPLS
jgi:hypothetical protein